MIVGGQRKLAICEGGAVRSTSPPEIWAAMMNAAIAIGSARNLTIA